MKTLRVTVVGAGAIGSEVARTIDSGAVPATSLAGVVVRRPESATEAGFTAITLEDALHSSDLVVECAGVPAVAQVGSAVIAAGRDLLVASVGALADQGMRESLLAGPGRLFVTTGAIGGLDLLSAASRDGGLDTVALTTSKTPSTVVQPWMSHEERGRVLSARRPLGVYTGTVADAIAKFPKSLNVAVALAVATSMWDGVTVAMVADPAATLTTHRIVASGAAGKYEFTISNRPHPDNPATSGILPSAVLAGIARLARPSGSFA